MKCKQFAAGFVTCLILLSAIFISGFAEGFTVLLNPYPITLNGVEIPVEAYNINGFTFLKLADVGKAIPGTTIKFNEIEKKIEISIEEASLPKAMDESEVESMSTTVATEYDYETKLPIGAEFVEYKSCKNAVRYNGNIYLPLEDLSKFGIRYHFSDIKTRITIFKVDDEFLEVDTSSTSGNYFLNASGKVFYNANLFSGIIGE
jgi:hypothetical protein